MKYGIGAALLSGVLFAVLYMYSNWMKPMSGTDVFAWRMPAMLGGLLFLLTVSRSWGGFFDFFRRMGTDWRRWLWLVLPTPIVGSQLWLFMWAPVNHYGVDAAMGYFLFPMVMVLFGRLFLKEHASRLQWLSLLFAGLGVAHELWQTAAFSWVTLWVCGTYPIYYLMRRKTGVPALTGLTVDLLLITPFALGYLYWHGLFGEMAEPSRYWLLIPLLGVLSAAAMQLNLTASRLLPVPLFGMLSYLEPALMFAGSLLLLGGKVDASSLWTYGLIWLGLLVSMADSWLKLRRRHGTAEYV